MKALLSIFSVIHGDRVLVRSWSLAFYRRTIVMCSSIVVITYLVPGMLLCWHSGMGCLAVFGLTDLHAVELLKRFLSTYGVEGRIISEYVRHWL